MCPFFPYTGTRRAAEKTYFRFSVACNNRLVEEESGRERFCLFRSITHLYLQITNRARRTGPLSRCLAHSRAEAKSADSGCSQSIATNALKHLMDQLEERILQTDQLKTLQSVCSIALTVPSASRWGL